MKDYKKILEGVVNIINTTEKSDIGFANICTYIGENCPELKEGKDSEDERIRKTLIHIVKGACDKYGIKYQGKEIGGEKLLAWLEAQGNKDEEILVLKDQIESRNAAIKAIKETHRIKLEKQDEHQKFIDAIQIGDKVTRNEDGVLVNLSQLKRVAKKDEKQDKNNMGISKATKQKLEDNLHKALEKETPESCNEFLEKQGEQKPDTDFSDLRTWKYIVDAVLTKENGIGNYLNSARTEAIAKELQERFGKIEQKPAKIELKFHEGEWLCENKPNNYARFIQILETVNVQGKERYRISRDIHNDEDIVEFDFIEKYYHKFDIKDAKDGDVLTYRDMQWVFIFKKMTDNTTFKYHALISEKGLAINDSAYTALPSCIVPATKEQRDALMKAMTDAGYVFNFDKKELKKLKFRVGDIVKSKSQPMLDARKIISIGKDCYWCEDRGCIGFALEYDCEIVEQKPAWSEEDDRMCKAIIDNIQAICEEGYFVGNIGRDELIAWLKILKYRVQPKQEWSEEDKLNLNQAIYVCHQNGYTAVENWLKFLKQRYTWKPSDEQMYNLSEAAHYRTKFWDCDILIGLYDELKKLK